MANKLSNKLEGKQIALIHKRTAIYTTKTFTEDEEHFRFTTIEDMPIRVNKSNVEKIIHHTDKGVYRIFSVEHAIVYGEMEFMESKFISCRLWDSKRNVSYSKIFSMNAIEGIKEITEENPEEENGD